MRLKWLVTDLLMPVFLLSATQASPQSSSSSDNRAPKGTRTSSTATGDAQSEIKFVHVPAAESKRLVANGQISLSGGSRVRIGTRLPDAKLQDLNGNSWSVTELNGKKTLLALWATWCLPCRAELPYLEKLSQTKGLGNIRIVAFSLDEKRSAPAAFVRKAEFHFPVIVQTADYIKQVLGEDQVAIPRYWLINTDRIIVREEIGQIRSDPERKHVVGGNASRPPTFALNCFSEKESIRHATHIAPGPNAHDGCSRRGRVWEPDRSARPIGSGIHSRAGCRNKHRRATPADMEWKRAALG